MCNWKWKRATVSQSSPGQELVYESQHVTTSFHAILWITKSHERFAHTHLHIEMKLDWQITSQVHQFIPVDAFTFSFRQPIGPISITSFDALKGLRGFGGAGIGPPFRKALLLHQGLQPLAQGPSFQPTDNENGNWMRENVPNVSTVFTFNVIQQCQSTLLLRHHGSISWQNAELQSQR